MRKFKLTSSNPQFIPQEAALRNAAVWELYDDLDALADLAIGDSHTDADGDTWERRMKGRLYRFTPAGGKPNHYTHDHSSAVRLGAPMELLGRLDLGTAVVVLAGTWERIA